MPLPNRGRVTGAWTRFDGAFNTGYVLLEAPAALLPYFATATGSGVSGRLIRIPLVSGSIDQMVPATDDTEVAPFEWLYKVSFLFDGVVRRSFNTSVKKNVTTNLVTALEENAGPPPVPGTHHSQLLGLDDPDAHPQYALVEEMPHVGPTPPLNPTVGRLWIPTT